MTDNVPINLGNNSQVGKGDPVLFYERVKTICDLGAYAAEKMPMLRLSHGAATRLNKKIKAAALTSDQISKMTPSELYEKFHEQTNGHQQRKTLTMFEPDFPLLFSLYLKSRDHDGKRTTETKLELTRKIIYEDYYDTEENRQKAAAQGLAMYSMSHFYKLWASFIGHKVSPVFRKPTYPGQQAEFDFCGVTLPCTDGSTAVFAVLVLNHSRMCYVEAIADQSLSSSAQSIINGFKFFGGVTSLVSIDNFKAAVKKAGVYGGELTDTFRMLAGFLGTSFISMQVRRGNLKGCAESTVKIVTHTLLARMRQEMRDGKQFKDLQEMNDWLKANLWRINSHKVRGLTLTRQELFDEEKTCLKPLPVGNFCLDEITTLTVPKTARIVSGVHQYALPVNLISRKIQMKKGVEEISFYEGGQKICTYKRKDDEEGLSIHNGYLSSTHLYIEVIMAIPESLLYEWALAIGPHTLNKIQSLLSRNHNTDTRRAVIKLLRLCDEHPAWYKPFDTFLASLGSFHSVSYISSHWSLEQKPQTAEKDSVYCFETLFKRVKAKLEGQEVLLRWPHPKEERAPGVAFMHYQPKASSASPTSTDQVRSRQ